MSTSTSKLRRLNFGCGYDKRNGYVNADSDPACEPDVLLVDNDLSVLAGEPFDEILANDVLEHIPRASSLDILLEWSDLLRLNGRLDLQTSSILGVARQLENTHSFDDHFGWTICLFGNQAHPGDFHHTGFTDITLRVHLLAAGFDVERTWLSDRWLLHATAHKATSWTEAATATGSDDEFIDCLFAQAFDRAPQPHEREFLLEALRSGQFDRRSACKHIWSAPERLFHVAAVAGLTSDSRPALVDRVRDHTPAALRPHLRRLRLAAHDVGRNVKRVAARRKPSNRY